MSDTEKIASGGSLTSPAPAPDSVRVQLSPGRFVPMGQSRQVIPDAAVEAAVFAVARNYGSAGTPNNTVLWTRLVSDIQTALEAAAPHMLNLAKREAWDANLEIQRLRAELAEATT